MLICRFGSDADLFLAVNALIVEVVDFVVKYLEEYLQLAAVLRDMYSSTMYLKTQHVVNLDVVGWFIFVDCRI